MSILHDNIRSKLYHKTLMIIALMIILLSCDRNDSTSQQPLATATPIAVTSAPYEPKPITAGSRQGLNEHFILGESDRVSIEVRDIMGAPAVLNLRFKGVMDDSRCATEIPCEGHNDALLIVDAELGEFLSDVIELHTHPQKNLPKLLFGLYKVHLIALTDSAAPEPNSSNRVPYRAELMVTRESLPTATPSGQPGEPLTIDACSLVETSQVVERFGSLSSAPQRTATETGVAQQCIFAAERGPVIIAWYVGDGTFARSLVTDLTEGGASLTALDSRTTTAATLIEGHAA